ncbi:hypothetical protein [Paraburkholderia rhizosphaerae]|uniref:PD-(D/E)XK nuclease superfamily protein n=1 Tax=Paraburkholderia rhizosphaerae TaxID=480658 RepID=A0A4R8LT43_9BURK|nr:hypothetical protein [Paraburkholderia rhizosphaerae]TDY49766.1 hypothetical protein BX592_11017 [Paraburkholderia rhizosphaerae]
MSTFTGEVSSKTVIGWIQGVLVHHQQDIPTYYMTKGGWEQMLRNWVAQALRTLPGEPSVQTEQHIYTDTNKAVDVLVTSRNQQYICIELKAESLFRSSDQGRSTIDHKFFEEFEEDIAKLGTVKPPFSQGLKLAVAVCLSIEAAQPLIDRQYQHDTFNLSFGHDTWRVWIVWH